MTRRGCDIRYIPRVLLSLHFTSFLFYFFCFHFKLVSASLFLSLFLRIKWKKGSKPVVLNWYFYETARADEWRKDLNRKSVKFLLIRVEGSLWGSEVSGLWWLSFPSSIRTSDPVPLAAISAPATMFDKWRCSLFMLLDNNQNLTRLL